MSSAKDTALALIERGLPITLCRGKQPLGKRWQSHRYTREDVEGAFSREPALNVGLILGPVSGIVDFDCDAPESEADFQELFGDSAPRTPAYTSRRGNHRLFTCHPRLEVLTKANVKYRSLEIRLGNRNAQSLLPPSTTDGFTREWLVSLDDCEPATLPDTVIDKILLANPVGTVEYKATSGDGRPGDEYNARAMWNDVLTPHGWTREGEDDERVLWQRPGKHERGHSATSKFCRTEGGKDLLYIFSTEAAPFEAGKTYDKFAAYALLNHEGDFGAAAAELASQGYGKPGGSKKKVADCIIELASDIELFHAPDNKPYATLEIEGHLETWPTGSKGFRDYLAHLFFSETGKAPSTQALTEALQVLNGQARFKGPEVHVFRRVAGLNSAVYLDLANPKWEAAEVTADGWRVVDKPPVKFIRPSGALALPYPSKGGSFQELRPFLNVLESDWPLVLAWLVAALRPSGPYPLLVLHGEQGTAKTTTAHVLRKLVDPNTAPLRPAPSGTRDLMIAANNGWLVGYDNLSGLPEWLSDDLCRLSTGGGFSTRELYSDSEELLLNVQRPALLTGIDNLAVRGDLLDRAIVFDLPVISKRRTEASFWPAFNEAQPRILGALLTAVAGAIRELPNVTLENPPRMADFAQWAVASEQSGAWGMAPGTFLAAYKGNQAEANNVLLDAPLPNAIRGLLAEHGKFEGTATELLTALEKYVRENDRFARTWPKVPHALTASLNRYAPNLRRLGVNIGHERDGKRRLIRLDVGPELVTAL